MKNNIKSRSGSENLYKAQDKTSVKNKNNKVEVNGLSSSARSKASDKGGGVNKSELSRRDISGNIEENQKEYKKIQNRINGLMNTIEKSVEKNKAEIKKYQEEFLTKYKLPNDAPKTFEGALDNIKNEDLSIAKRIFSALLIHFQSVECTEEQEEQFGEAMEDLAEDNSPIPDIVKDLIEKFEGVNLEKREMWAVALKVEENMMEESLVSDLPLSLVEEGLEVSEKIEASMEKLSLKEDKVLEDNMKIVESSVKMLEKSEEIEKLNEKLMGEIKLSSKDSKGIEKMLNSLVDKTESLKEVVVRTTTEIEKKSGSSVSSIDQKQMKEVKDPEIKKQFRLLEQIRKLFAGIVSGFKMVGGVIGAVIMKLVNVVLACLRAIDSLLVTLIKLPLKILWTIVKTVLKPILLPIALIYMIVVILKVKKEGKW